MNRVCFAVILVVFATVAFGQSPPPPAVRNIKAHSTALSERARVKSRQQRTVEILRVLNKPVSVAEFDEEPFEEVLDWMRDQGLKNTVVSWKRLDRLGVADKQTPITLTLSDATVGDVLDMVLDLASVDATGPSEELTYHVFDGVLRISTREHFAGQMVTRTYYVADLLVPITSNDMMPFIATGTQTAYVAEQVPVVATGAVAVRPVIGVIDSGSKFGPGDPQDGQPDMQGMRDDNLANLIDLIKTVRPNSWTDNGGRGTVAAFSDKLVIYQSIEMHEMIGGTFQQLGPARK